MPAIPKKRPCNNAGHNVGESPCPKCGGHVAADDCVCDDCGADQTPEGPPHENPACPTCGGVGAELGALGNRTHYRCISCGLDFSKDD